MKKLTDEEIQQLLDSHLIIEPSDQVELYQKVFSELSKFPDVHLDHLAHDVALTVQNQIERKVTIKTYLAIGIGLAIAFFVFITVSFSVDILLTLKILSVLNTFKWVIAFLVTMFAISAACEKFISKADTYL